KSRYEFAPAQSLSSARKAPSTTTRDAVEEGVLQADKESVESTASAERVVIGMERCFMAVFSCFVGVGCGRPKSAAPHRREERAVSASVRAQLCVAVRA